MDDELTQDGTPKDLKMAVTTVVALPMSVVLTRGPYVIKDFLAQRFAVAYMNVENDDELRRLRKLWNSITEGL